MYFSKTWWRVEQDPHKELFGLLHRIARDTSEREDCYRRYLRLYEGHDVLGLTPSTLTTPMPGNIGKLISLNVVQSCVDTIVALICSQEPRPMLLTEEGQWDLKQRAKLLERFVSGTMYDVEWYEKAREAFIDAAVFGTGFLKITDDSEKSVICERVFPYEVVVDERAALVDNPRSLFQQKEISAEVLMARYPKFEEEIQKSTGDSKYSAGPGEIITTDLVCVVEAWHLPSGKEAGDGRHIIAVENATLLDEEWTEDDFPFVVFRWNRRRLRFYGQGLAEQLEGVQEEINKLLVRIQNAMHIYSVANTYVEEGSLVSNDHLDNSTGKIIQIRKGFNFPRTDMPSVISNEVFSHLWKLHDSAYEKAGISQMSATSRKPAGIESGVALQTVLDVETRRFAMPAKQWEDAAKKSAIKFISTAKRIHKDEKPLKVYYRARDFVKSINWADVDMEADQYVLQVWPVNLLPKTPSGKLDAVDKMIQRGMIDQVQGQALLDFPDLERFRSLTVASLDDIDAVIGSIITDGKYTPPEPYQNLEMGLQRVTSALLRARLDGVPIERLELLEQWIAEAAELMQPQQPPASLEMPPGPPMDEQSPAPPLDASQMPIQTPEMMQ